MLKDAKIKLYIDGMADTTRRNPGQEVGYSNAQLWIGDDVNNPGSAAFSGKLDEVAILARALNDAEIIHWHEIGDFD